MNKNVIVIPCLEPTSKLLSYIDELVMNEFKHIIVVNDGSGREYDEIFNEIEKKQGCKVLGYSKNCGKGYALKWAYQYIAFHLKDAKGIITVDSDGQHSIQDVCKIDDRLTSLQDKKTLVLGARDFSGENIPFKSRLGNRVSSFMCMLLNGKWFKDTQTGLRGFDIQLLPMMLSVEGDRFEYEMNVLNQCLQNKVNVMSESIQTIYENNNKSTHFKAVSDSFCIAKAILGQFIKFAGVSCLSSLVDLSIAWILFEQLKNYIQNDFLRIACATIIARLISMSINYILNKYAVFDESKKRSKSIGRYIVLCIIVMCLSSCSVFLMKCLLKLDEKMIKVLVDMLLFVFSYKMQKQWVFHQREGNYGT